MTVLVPLDAGSSSSSSSSPSFVTASAAPDTHLAKTMAAIMKAKRIVVICGAGISVQAGIPDFRSSEGLFQSIKRDNPKEQLSSGKELFDASVFNSEHKTSLFCQMIAQLSDLSQAAQPTPFHNLLRALDDRGRLLRVYTQNIDAIEQKSGLSFGVPEFDDRRYKSRSKGKQKEVDDQPLVVDPTTVASCDHAVGPSAVDTTVPSTSATASSSSTPADPSTSASRLPSPPVETPRCIPLHGTLQAMHCQICTRSFPLSDYIPALNAGQPPPCPECTSLERTRQLVGKRPRGIGRLRPSVVLYNEDHKDGEGVGEVVRRDLVGGSKGKGRSGADLVLVVGTSLRVPGTKRMVREFSKAVKARAGVGVKDEVEKTVSKDKATTTSSGGLSTPAPSPRRTPSTDDDVLSSPPRALYLNLDFPVPTREWENVFDVWIQGDAQQFAELLKAEIEKENKVKQESSEKKKRKEEDMVDDAEDTLPDGSLLVEKSQKVKAGKVKENAPQDKTTREKQKDGKPQARRKPSANSRAPVGSEQDIEAPGVGKRRKTAKTCDDITGLPVLALSNTPIKSKALSTTPPTPPITPTSRLLPSQKAKARSKLAATVSHNPEPPHAKLFLRIPARGAGPAATAPHGTADASPPPPLPAAGICLESSSSNEETEEDNAAVPMDSAPDSDNDDVVSAPAIHILSNGRRDATPPLPQDVWAPTYSPGATTSALPTAVSEGRRKKRRSSALLQQHEDLGLSRNGNLPSESDDYDYGSMNGRVHRQNPTGNFSPPTSFSDEGSTSDTLLSDRDESMDVDVTRDDMDVDDVSFERRGNIYGWHLDRTPRRRNSSPPRHADYRTDEVYLNHRPHYTMCRDAYPLVHTHPSSYSYSAPYEYTYPTPQYYHSRHPQSYISAQTEYLDGYYSAYTTQHYSHTNTYQQYAAHAHYVPLSAPPPSYMRPEPSSHSRSYSRREARHGRNHPTAPPLNAHRQLSSGVLISTAPLLSGIRDTAS